MTLLIYYTVNQLSKVFNTTPYKIGHLTRLGIIPTVPNRKPFIFDKKEIDKWVEDGNLEKFIKEYDHSDYIIS